MDVSKLREVLPSDTLKFIYKYYSGLVNTAVSRIQFFYACRKQWTTWQCTDCRRFRLRSNLVKAQSCDDYLGCCFKRVCKDGCTFYCNNGHLNRSICELKFYDACPYDRYEPCLPFEYNDQIVYCSHSITCVECECDVYVERCFTFDIWEDSRRAYEIQYNI